MCIIQIGEYVGRLSEDFKDTIDLVNELEYDLAYTFIYSPREGTPASIIPDSTDMDTKKRRLAELNELINKYKKDNNIII